MTNDLGRAPHFRRPAARPFGGEPARPVLYSGDPDRVRARLKRILSKARAAAAMPWDRQTARLYATIVPQMTLWLPDDEAAQWRLDFASEMERLADTDRQRRRPLGNALRFGASFRCRSRTAWMSSSTASGTTGTTVRTRRVPA